MFHCFHTWHEQIHSPQIKKKQKRPFEVFVLMQLQHPPVFMQIDFIIKVSECICFFSAFWKKEKIQQRSVHGKKKNISKLAI